MAYKSHQPAPPPSADETPRPPPVVMAHNAPLSEKKAIFLGVMAQHFAIAPAAVACGLNRTTIHTWMREDAAFKRAVDEAREIAIDVLEDSAYQRALKGDVVLTIFLLKGNRPDRYQDRQHITSQAIGTVKVEFDTGPAPLYTVHTLPTPQAMARIGDPPIDADAYPLAPAHEPSRTPSCTPPLDDAIVDGSFTTVDDDPTMADRSPLPDVHGS